MNRDTLTFIKTLFSMEIPVPMGLITGFMALFVFVFIGFGIVTYSMTRLTEEPVVEQPVGMYHVQQNSKELYVELLSEWYAYSYNSPENQGKLGAYLNQMDVATVACGMINEQTELGKRQRLVSIAALENGYGCRPDGENQ